MNNNISQEDDFLKRYMKPGMREKAPGNIGSIIMSRIHLEPVVRTSTAPGRKKFQVPVVSLTIVMALILAALLFTTKGSVISIPELDTIKIFSLYFSDPGFDSIQFVSPPKVVLYLIFGLMLLSVFDKILYRFFNRKHK
jgi:hypothetical protein